MTDRTDRAAGDALYRAIFESAVDFAIIATDHGGRVTDWNTGAERILGWPAGEMRGESAACIFTVEDRTSGQPEAEMRRALDTGRATDERWHLRRDGTRFWGSGEMTVLRGEDGAHLGFLKILRDRTAQRRAEERLRESEATFRATFEQAAVGVAQVGLDGRWLRVNARLCEMLGYSEAELLAHTFQEVTYPEDIEPNLAHVRRLLSGEAATYDMEKRYLRRDGSVVWAALTSALRRDPDGGAPLHFVSVMVDITARKRAEAALRESEEQLRLATEAAEVGLWDLDPAVDALFWPPRVKAMFGISPDVPVSMADFYAGLYPDDRERVTLAFAAALDPARRALYDVEYRTVGKEDGLLRWVAAKGRGLFDAHGACVRVIGTAIDVTARKRAEERLRESEARLRELNETLERRVADALAERKLWADVFANTDALIAALAPGRRFLALNRAYAQEFERIYGVRPRVGDDLGELLASLPEHRAAALAIWDRALAGEEFTVIEEFGDAGRDRPCYELRFNVLRDRDWRPVGAFQYAVDVTDRLHAQAQLAQAAEQLRQSQKMEAVGQLTGGLAHDFNNLLTGITGSLELLRTRLAQGRLGEVERYVVAAQGAATRAAALTHRLLAFSRRQTLDPKPTDVNRLVAGMEELVRRTVGPAITIEVVGAAGVWATLVDPNQLENALLNLCINARDAMPDGGRLTIETANRWLDGRSGSEPDLSPGQYVSVCVTDTGMGMTPDVIQRAFDPFFTTKPVGMGTGLGLSMVYGFARQSGGQARIYSEVGRGTTMCLYLPRHFGPAEAAEAASQPVERTPAAPGKTVLVVDDEPTVRMLVVEVLRDLGYAALEAADGAAGLQALQSAERVDLLVTDVGLPGGMNGRQLADAARQSRPGLRVLFITGYAENAVVGNGHLEPGMHVFTKPFAMEALASRIRGLLAGE